MSLKDHHMDVSVWRGDAKGGEFQEFEVPAQKSQTVLDVVAWIQQNVDPTLSYRFACRVGMCGSCAMMVNGKPRWTCRTHVKNALCGNGIRIAPLRNLPVIKDLATDMDPFFDKWIEAEGVFHPSRTRADAIDAIRPLDTERAAADAGIECINCSICYASCDTVAGNAEFLGPAALNRAWTLVNDSRDAARELILDAVSRSGGCHNCHSMGSCAHFCPNDLNPMNSIAGLKRATALAIFKRGS
jgi:fumarate reductase iron-sulfur subunit